MPRVLNNRSIDIPNDGVLIDRSTKWGNPFSHKSGTLAKYQVDTREEAILFHRDWFLNSDEAKPLRESLHELKGKDLVCWCAPRACHGDTLLELANAL